MRAFQSEGLIRAVGMRGPHRFALDRLRAVSAERGDKVARFRHLFQVVEPQVLAVRDNLLTPSARSEGLFAFAEANRVGVLVNKPLAQGLLTGRHSPVDPPVFGPGDHRLRKRWFTPDALRLIDRGLARLREITGSDDPRELIRLALWACLARGPHVAVLVGFTSADQVRANLAAVAVGAPPVRTLDEARRVMGEVQAELDATGEVFVDECPEGGPR